MMTLAIETSTRLGSVAVVDRASGNTLFEESFVAERSHNARIFGPLGRALSGGGRRAGEIVVGTGPGSYTGTRIGIAAAQGMALALGAPVRGACSLLAVEPAPGDRFLVVGDARRGAFFAAEVSGGALPRAPEVVERDEALARVARFREAGLAVVTFDEAPPLEGVECRAPRASRLARLPVADGGPAEGPIEPIYLRAPFVTRARPRGLAPPAGR